MLLVLVSSKYIVQFVITSSDPTSGIDCVRSPDPDFSDIDSQYKLEIVNTAVLIN